MSPFKSKAQVRKLFATNPTLAEEFASKTHSIKSLPEHSGGNKMAKKKLSKSTKASNYWKNSKGRKAPLGEGGRFKALKKSIGMKGGVRNPGAVAASIGRKKYGKAAFQTMAAKGKK